MLLDVFDACVGQRTASTLITSHAGYHSDANLEALAARKIDGLIAEGHMRQGDE